MRAMFKLLHFENDYGRKFLSWGNNLDDKVSLTLYVVFELVMRGCATILIHRKMSFPLLHYVKA